MRKYATIFRVKLDEYFAYRLNFVMWRLRTVLGFLLLYFVWANVAVGNREIAGYSTEEIFTYIFFANIVNAVVLSSVTSSISGEILNGDIINYLLKPMGFFRYILVREAVDKTMNVAFSILEFGIFYLIFRPPISFQTDPLNLIAFAAMLLVAMAISFFVSLSLSFIAFWSTEIWAPRFIFFVLISLLAGTVFPLDILPEPLYQAFLLTPFPYFVYAPTKMFVTGITPATLAMLGTGCLWVLGTGFLAISLWRKGIREFSFFGR
jgi:ABC-2 type transport system permease protein